MKIVIAPDSYKESLSATEVAQAIEKGFREIFPMLNTFQFRSQMAVRERLKP
jgi:glycerate kinase